MSSESQLYRAIVQQLASLSAAGVRQLGHGEVNEALLVTSADAETSPRTTATPEDPSPAPMVHENTASPSPREASASPVASEIVTSLTVLAEQVAGCTKCDELCTQRTQTVFGVGNPAARLCFLGEAPGAEEDRLGQPFVGKAGQLLTKIIEAMGLKRDEVYITNVLKCRPPGNRNPAPGEVANCRPFFDEQLSLIQPEFICCLGAIAAQNLLGTTKAIGKLRGEFQDWQGSKVLATYHPAYLLRNPSAKKMVWDDMQILMKAMGLELPR